MNPSTTVQIRAEDKTKQAFRQISERTQRLKSSFGGLATMAVGVAGALGIGALMSSLRDLGDRIGKVSLQIGVSSNNLQKLQFAAEQSGLSTDTLNTAMQKFAINIGKANDGAKIQSEAFAALGVETKNLDGTTKSVFDLFKATSDGLGTLTDKTLQARLASELFGRTGVEMTVLFAEGAEGIDHYGKQLASINGIIGGDSIDAIQRFNDSWNLMTKIVRGFLLDSKTLNLLSDIIDGWAFGIQKLNEKFGEQKKIIRDINTVSQDLKLARKETVLFQLQIEQSVGDEKEEAIERLKTNKNQIKTLQIELLESKKIETNILNQKTAQKQVKKGIEATNKVAKDLNKTIKPLMIGGKLDIPAIGGRKGLGGTLESFTMFYQNLMILAQDYLGLGFGVAGIVKKNLTIINQDFTEMITGMQNHLVFRRNDISEAFSTIITDLENALMPENHNIEEEFSKIMLDFEHQLKELDLQISNIKIMVPPEAFDFSSTNAIVPGFIFDFSKVKQSAGVIDSLVSQINSYSVGSRSVSRSASARGDGSTLQGMGQPYPYWSDETGGGSTIYGKRNLNFNMPQIKSTLSLGSSSKSGPDSFSSGSTSMSNTSAPQIQVNIYDGTNQKISEYDSALRIEIKDVTSRQGTLPPLRIS